MSKYNLEYEREEYMRKRIKWFVVSAITAGMLLWGEASIPMETLEIYAAADLEEIPSYTGEPYAVVNDNIPEFAEEDFEKESFEIYSEFDELGRCGAAYANRENRTGSSIRMADCEI